MSANLILEHTAVNMKNFWTIDLIGGELKITLDELKRHIEEKSNNVDYPIELVDEILYCITLNDDNEVSLNGSGTFKKDLSEEFIQILEWLHYECDFEDNIVNDWEGKIGEDEFEFDYGSSTFWSCDDGVEPWYHFFLLEEGHNVDEKFYYEIDEE